MFPNDFIVYYSTKTFYSVDFFFCVIAFLVAQYFKYSLHQGIRESTMNY